MIISEFIGLAFPALISLTWLGLNMALVRKLSRIEKLASTISVQKAKNPTLS